MWSYEGRSSAKSRMGTEPNTHTARHVTKSPTAHDPVMLFNPNVELPGETTPNRRSSRRKRNPHPDYRRQQTLLEHSDPESSDKEPRSRPNHTIHDGETEDELVEDADNEYNDEDHTIKVGGEAEGFEQENQMPVEDRDRKREHKDSGRATNGRPSTKNTCALVPRDDIQTGSSPSPPVPSTSMRSKKRKENTTVRKDTEERSVKRERSEHASREAPTSPELTDFEDDDELMALKLKETQLLMKKRMKELRRQGKLA
ncbi:hypothetical protein AC579_3884 [Pseudocercospora musae]|uniref:Uncharacterized protein n=1 Tax=Pseudocercospora musae TaxID=113226 RepID=A0A139IRH7_9PEZI|nr:hypothetical protein AC579_3884 [Pseudocercospora musae]